MNHLIQNRPIESFEGAKILVLNQLKKKGFVWDHVSYINQGRYALVYGNKGNILIAYKREPFYKYGNGVGDSFNSEDITIAIKEGVTKIYTVFRNSPNRIYTIDMEDFLKGSQRREIKEGKFVRSFSIHLYEGIKIWIKW